MNDDSDPDFQSNFFADETKRQIALATQAICAICMASAKLGNAFPIMDATNTIGDATGATNTRIEYESTALQLGTVDRKNERNGLWLCQSCHARISYGRAMFCPPSQLMVILIEAFTSNPATNLRQIIQQPEVVPWLNYYLLVVPNIDIEAVDVFPTRRPKSYKFVNNVGFTKSNASDPGETYLIYKTSDGPMASSARTAVVDLARDEERSRRLWHIPQIDIVNVLMMALWNLRLADIDASSHRDVIRDLARLHILLWQRKLTVLSLERKSSIITDEDDDDSTSLVNEQQ
ncbi:hypothetical protein B0H16DRAFT_1512132 [Mycena metata]|uniref:Uncharacterized protein n=1 Tax=Mycena metata TaxID=1033252 RepID=A0AAD7K0X6_9AGAR|nr:hypothetical protein B0H16DRAFT_1512132 [Mycena metata]